MNTKIPVCMLLGSVLTVTQPILAAEQEEASSPLTFVATPLLDTDKYTIKADNPAFAYEGRFDMSKAEAPRLYWQGGRILVDFEGDELTLLLELASGKTFCDITIDGQSGLLELQKGTNAWKLTTPIGKARHRLEILKRNEAGTGSLRFKGIVLGKKGKVHRPVYNYHSRLIFFGDSITVGACNEDGPEDQWEDLATHNTNNSYSMIFGRMVNADVQNIALSGIGMVTGWNTAIFAPQVWNRYAPMARGNLADLKAWTPDVVFTNFGENDASYSQANGSPFPEAYTETYIKYIQELRKTWPTAKIVILRGGMYHGKNDPALAQAVDAVRSAFADDKLIYGYNFVRSSNTHPRVSAHRDMAEELVQFFKQTDGLKDLVPSK